MDRGASEILRDTSNVKEARNEQPSKNRVQKRSQSLGVQAVVKSNKRSVDKGTKEKTVKRVKIDPVVKTQKFDVDSFETKARHVISHPPRYQYVLPTGSSTKKKTSKKNDNNTDVAPWSNVEVEIIEPPLQCFICGKDGEGNPVRSCTGYQNGIKGRKKHQCSTMYHLSCLETYTASGYNAEYIKQPECKNELLCPLHFCNACYSNRQVQSSFEGMIVECAACYRAFHVDCEPCGSMRVIWMMDDDDKKIPVNMFICPSHADMPKPPKHMPVCCECEQTNGTLQKCKKCVRSFHPECSTIATVDGKPNDKTVCEFCLNQETLPLGSSAIALYQKEWFVGNPKIWSAVSNLNMKTYTVGKVIVQWEGYTTWNIIPANQVIQFFAGAKKFLAKCAKSEEAYETAIEMEEDELNKPQPYREVKKRISASIYLDPKLRQLLDTEDVFVCDCKDKPGTDGIRCGDDCHNRASMLECPPECAKRPGGCANRSISEKNVCENIERRQTERKGFGVFATADIKEGEFIAEYAGEIITKAVANDRIQLVQESKDLQAHLYMMQLSSNRIVDAARKGNIARYINHSCSPNCQTRVVRIVVRSFGDQVKYDERVGITAIKNIREGEELTFKYQMLNDGNEPPECFCESDNCTGTLGKVAEEDDKPAAVKQKSKSTKKRGPKVEPEPEEEMPARAATTALASSKSGKKSRKESKSPTRALTSVPQAVKRSKKSVEKSPSPTTSAGPSKRGKKVIEKSPSPATSAGPSKRSKKAIEAKPEVKPKTAAKKKAVTKVRVGNHDYSPVHITVTMPSEETFDALDAMNDIDALIALKAMNFPVVKEHYTCPLVQLGDPQPSTGYFTYNPAQYYTNPPRAPTAEPRDEFRRAKSV